MMTLTLGSPKSQRLLVNDPELIKWFSHGIFLQNWPTQSIFLTFWLSKYHGRFCVTRFSSQDSSLIIFMHFVRFGCFWLLSTISSLNFTVKGCFLNTFASFELLLVSSSGLLLQSSSMSQEPSPTVFVCFSFYNATTASTKTNYFYRTRVNIIKPIKQDKKMVKLRLKN